MEEKMKQYMTFQENRVDDFESGATSIVYAFFYPLPNIILVITIGSELHCILKTKAEVRPEKCNFITTSEGNYL